jgi:hypothetical protein
MKKLYTISNRSYSFIDLVALKRAVFLSVFSSFLFSSFFTVDPAPAERSSLLETPQGCRGIESTFQTRPQPQNCASSLPLFLLLPAPRPIPPMSFIMPLSPVHTWFLLLLPFLRSCFPARRLSCSLLPQNVSSHTYMSAVLAPKVHKICTGFQDQGHTY